LNKCTVIARVIFRVQTQFVRISFFAKIKRKIIVHYDVAVIGGGMAGLVLSLILAKGGVRTICIDHADPALSASDAADGRTMAISWGSRQVVARAGIWDVIGAQACPIDDIRITQNGGRVLLRFQAEEVEGRSFGWIAGIGHMRRTLIEAAAAQDNLDFRAPCKAGPVLREDGGVRIALGNKETVRASLLIGADGRKSMVRDLMGVRLLERSYGQSAIVCTVTHENPHENAATEDFRPEGPFAILPMIPCPDTNAHCSSVVWSEHAGRRGGAASVKDYDEETFNAALAARFPAHYGAVTARGPRFSYPLSLVLAKDYIAPRMALIADAAHGIHPIAGQGLNLGLRDVNCLADLVIEAVQNKKDPGDQALLRQYQRLRRFDNTAMAAATDGLNALFSNTVPGLPGLRRTGLRMVERLPPVKRFFMRQAMGDRAF
jgi:2-octaprenyl-6-methoxyphenol hydroxylase